MEEVRLDSDVERLARSLGELPEPTVRPAFVVVSGLPGTGKSYFCRKLAERIPLVILESDALRKALFRQPTYTKEESAYLFQVIHLLIERLLNRGIPMVLDATNLSERYREQLYHIADRYGAQLILVMTMAPPVTVQQRLETRAAGPAAASDADWEVYTRMAAAGVERIRRNHFIVDTSRDIAPAIDKVVREINRTKEKR